MYLFYIIQNVAPVLIKHPAGTSVNSVNYAPCGKFYLLHYNVSLWEFQISHCFNSIIFIQNILL